MDLEQVQKSIGYFFHDPRLLKLALVHRSYLHERTRDPEVTEHNERLEFLGDAVLEMVVTEYLFKHYDDPEGYLTSLRAALVNYKIMGRVGQVLGLDEQILLSQSEREEYGKARVSIVADAMEAVIGAMYLDAGMEECDRFIKECVLIYLPDIVQSKSYKDKKTALQEFTQKHSKNTPRYKVLFSEGKDHEKTFHVGVWVDKHKVAEASGRSKQAAEQQAARIALDILQEQSIVAINANSELHIPHK
jgi:ribonuclease-3